LKISKDLFIAPIEVGASIKLNNIFFETGKSTLKPTSFPELERVIKFLNENSTLKIEIAGHTDNVGNAATNKNLSQARANAVANYIIKNGVAKDRIVAKGYGMEKPVASNKTAAGKSQNRRVEFTILDK
jgi:outer membrane protein OmpA-like peptidoglycan-associated protein